MTGAAPPLASLPLPHLAHSSTSPLPEQQSPNTGSTGAAPQLSPLAPLQHLAIHSPEVMLGDVVSVPVPQYGVD